jgi:hypothetical protein
MEQQPVPQEASTIGMVTVLGHMMSSRISLTCTLDGQLDSIKNEEQIEFSDRSAPLFAMYQKKTEDEDSKMTDRWQKDADGILIFVSPYLRASPSLLNKF